ncbi:MAG TPA: carbon storage regulator [Planctomycetaceae bacterium]|nr:carbon storage regulator [Planctomycetaceae bacterium]|tara:strand:- start:14673 stop:14864 length:192 start_codon:yes stop_codon:yes gene_type:complete
MLNLYRKVNESIMIGDDIEVMVVKIRGSQVRLGVKADRDVRVTRGEHLEGEDDVQDDGPVNVA